MSIELFKFASSDPATGKLTLEQGRIINGLTSVMWVERYRDAGEFTITAPMSSGLKEFLPINAILSHTNTTEFMVVENHSIVDDNEGLAELTISGRSYETFLENRVVTGNGITDATDAVLTYTLTPAARPSIHIQKLIEAHVYTCAPHQTQDKILNLRTAIDFGLDPSLGVSEIREIKAGDLYKAVLELLSLDNLGIRTVRPGPWLIPYQTLAAPGGPFDALDDVGFIIHKGFDRSNEIAFSYDLGEITNAEYLWSTKGYANSVLVQGKWLRARVNEGPGPNGYENFERRVLYVDGSDIDGQASAEPSGGTRTSMLAAMQARARQVLASNNGVSIARVEVTQNNPRFRYGIDYEVGDIVGVNGNYDIVGKMQVTEHVTIIDQYGYTSYPTLSVV